MFPFHQTISCGEDYTVAGATDNHLYLWGKGWLTSDTSNDSTKSSMELGQGKGQEVSNGRGSLGSTGSLKIPMEKIMEATSGDGEQDEEACKQNVHSHITSPLLDLIELFYL